MFRRASCLLPSSTPSTPRLLRLTVFPRLLAPIPLTPGSLIRDPPHFVLWAYQQPHKPAALSQCWRCRNPSPTLQFKNSLWNEQSQELFAFNKLMIKPNKAPTCRKTLKQLETSLVDRNTEAVRRTEGFVLVFGFYFSSESRKLFQPLQ